MAAADINSPATVGSGLSLRVSSPADFVAWIDAMVAEINSPDSRESEWSDAWDLADYYAHQLGLVEAVGALGVRMPPSVYGPDQRGVWNDELRKRLVAVRMTLTGQGELVAARQRLAATASPSALAEPETGGTTDNYLPAANPLLTHLELAKMYRVESETARKRLDRWRKKHAAGDDWNEVSERRPNEPQYLYKLSAVKSLFEGNSASG
ncbi:MAG: hypothetical protein WD851_09310 [Pirellulales bacterium]